MYCKIHKSVSGSVLAVCDNELIGKTFESSGLHFHVSEAFYKGFEISPKKLAELLESHTNINIVGEKAVRVALQKGLITERNIVKIGNIPHVQIYKL
ncbi:MAG: DUF424 family protein [Candidatus Diapherotrites archaeon]|nr:DUF424 family protein [Candidatus Diapherotrites archaeon]